jgi:hypothetical protein
MEERRVWGSRQYVASASVIALHLALVIALVSSTRSRQSSPQTPREASFLVSVSSLLLPKIRGGAARKPAAGIIKPRPSVSPSLPGTAPTVSEPEEKQASTDWAAAALLSATRVTTPRSEKQFGTFPVPADAAPAPKHRAGDHDRLDAGEHVDWISDRCYVISDPSNIAGPPDVVMQGMQFVGPIPGLNCLPEKDLSTLFKESIETFSEYKRYAPK